MWPVAFVSDALFNSRKLRALTLVDAFTREALAIDVDQLTRETSLTNERLLLALGRPKASQQPAQARLTKMPS